jgi:hypothetical protein
MSPSAKIVLASLMVIGGAAEILLNTVFKDDKGDE